MKDFIINLHSSGILEWKINRPEKRNAVNFNVIAGLETVLDRAENDNNVKALVITGEGEYAFCSGGDLDEFHQLKTEEEAYSMLSKMGLNLYRLATLSKPTLALINGTAVGGGCEIATACDFRIAKTGSKLGFIQGKLGITTGWGGASLLYEKIPSHSALKILLEANIYSAEELKELGFIHQVYPTVNVDTAYQFLREIVKNDMNVLKSYKQVLISRWQSTNLFSRIDQEIRQCSMLWEKEEHHQAVSKFLSK
ncbi:enoyl-CoA hydratase/isomerase family protein [Heyndrickxia sp. NPDC080065]|uniref:enoyl-CoA hydratase/isomerase family protein n=1 Tax=Heyndrickxia sp. NPDC080065 TaxID=3390568 RepID=UPI003D0051C9